MGGGGLRQLPLRYPLNPAYRGFDGVGWTHLGDENIHVTPFCHIPPRHTAVDDCVEAIFFKVRKIEHSDPPEPLKVFPPGRVVDDLPSLTNGGYLFCHHSHAP